MAENVQRISPEAAQKHVNSDALLVCAYDDPHKFEQNHLAGAISLDEFKAQAGSLPRDREVVFYCA